MKDTYYFSHDYNAHNDVKILFMRQQLGMEGYGIYWFLIESLADSGGYLPMKIIPVLAMQMHTNEVKVKAVIESFELFEVNENQFFSSRLLEHLEVRNNIKKMNSEKGKRSAELRKSTAVQQRLNCGSTKERKGKESKEKEIDINKEISSFKQFPVHTDLNPLPEFMVNSIKLQIINLKHVELSDEKILSLWQAFIVENINGSKFYQTESEIHKHFSNWLKKQNINATNNGHTKTRQQTTNESIEYIKQKGNELFNRINKSEI
jgi:uncharacterized protein YdaU (DUF1376 family)